MKRAALASFVLIALSLVIPAAGLKTAAKARPVGPSDGWKIVRTEHFTFSGDASEAELRETAIRLEQFRSAISQVFPKLKLEVPGVETNIVIFKDPDSYQPFRPLRPNGTVDDAVDGYFQPGDDVNYIVTAIRRRPKDDPFGLLDRSSIGTVFHEYAHFLVRTNFRHVDIPPWIDEGVAEYFETFQIADGKTAVLGVAQPGIALGLDEKSILSPSAIFAIDDTTLRSGTRAARRVFYAEAWALVHYLLHSQTGDRYAALHALLTDKETAEQKLQKAFGTDVRPFGQALAAYVNQPTLTRSEHSLDSNLASPTVGAAASLGAAETDALLGDIFLHLDRRDDAAVYLRRAIAAAPDLPSANGSLGMLLVRQDNFADGRKFLEKAVAGGNKNHLVAENLADAIIRSQMNANREVGKFAPEISVRLRELLQRACDAAPEFAESRRLLAFVKLVDGDDLAGAAALAKRAIELEPANEQHRLLLARILLRQEKYFEARSAAERLTLLSTNTRVRSDAAEIVKAVDAYYLASGQTSPDKILTVFTPLPPLILKRSAVSEADLARFEEDRVINNLNRILPRPLAGERQVTGYIQRISCMNDGRVEYDVIVDGLQSIFTSSGFSSLRLAVLTEGERTFKLDCGSRLDKQLTVLTFRPPKNANAGLRPELVAVAFVPDNFKLKTQEELSKARLVVVEDDTISSRGKRN